MDLCPLCKHKSLRQRKTDNLWKCTNCHSIFRSDKRFISLDNDNRIIADKNGNCFRNQVETDGNFIINKTIYILEDGKVTLNGEFPKLKKECKHMERLDCNYGIGYTRCEFMVYQEPRWICTEAK